MFSVVYKDIWRTDKSGDTICHFRERMVSDARKRGIRATALRWNVALNTVRKWVRRYETEGREGLRDRSSRPAGSPHAMRPWWRFTIEKACRAQRRRHERIRVAVLKRRLAIPYSEKAIWKVVRAAGYGCGREMKRQRRRDLHAVKRHLKVFEVIQVDIKHLTDIASLLLAQKCYGLPKYQITARDVRSGALWVDYLFEKSVTNTTLFIHRLLEHLRQQGVHLGQVTIQTDNGKECTTWFDSPKTTSFERAILKAGANYRHIPIGAKTYQSDVEVTHRLIEDELYIWMRLPTTPQFLTEAGTYLHGFNTERRIRARDGTALEVVQRQAPAINPAVVQWQPMIVDCLLTRPMLEYLRGLAA